jgi:multisubunit Na+/H+ antiporter MnhF subunit
MKVTLLLNTALLAMFYAAWCCVDYRLVHSPQYPQNIADGDWILTLIPTVTFATNFVVYRGQGLRKALFAAILASVALCVLFLVVLVLFGLSFHLSIGGRI